MWDYLKPTALEQLHFASEKGQREIYSKGQNPTHAQNAAWSTEGRISKCSSLISG